MRFEILYFYRSYFLFLFNISVNLFYLSLENKNITKTQKMKFDLIDPPHQDLINDIAFDYYGKRFATCSSDKSIKVWDYDETEKKWKSVYINRAHEDSIWRLSWAHPEFGQIFASCSEDGSVKIWEEREDSDDPKDKWFARAHLLKLSKSVNDIKFAPRNVGLKLATASSDGIIRIIEPKDLFNLASENFNIKV